MIEQFDNNSMNGFYKEKNYKIHLLFCFFLLIILVGCQIGLKQVNQELFLVINEKSKFIDPSVWCSLTLFGDTSVLWPMLLLFMWHCPRTVFAAISAIPLGGILSVALKHLFGAPRPAILSDTFDITILGPVLTGNGFPSGHTITAFAAACAVIMTIEYASSIQQKIVSYSVLILAILVGLSRIMVGAHWPYDVLAGAFVGWIGGISGVILARRLDMFWEKGTIQWITILLLWLLSVGNLFREFDYPLGTPAVWISCLMATLGLILFFLSLRKKQ